MPALGILSTEGGAAAKLTKREMAEVLTHLLRINEEILSGIRPGDTQRKERIRHIRFLKGRIQQLTTKRNRATQSLAG